MRMWMIPPQFMCRQHLLGEHSELHKFLPSWQKQRSITGYIRSNAAEPSSYVTRHAELVTEMLRRGYKHQSPLATPDFSYLPLEEQQACVDRNAAWSLLLGRCQACRELYVEGLFSRVLKGATDVH